MAIQAESAPSRPGYLRGYRFRRSQEPKAVPYVLPEQFRGLDPDDIVLSAIRQFVP
jgi:hypothetical protein